MVDKLNDKLQEVFDPTTEVTTVPEDVKGVISGMRDWEIAVVINTLVEQVQILNKNYSNLEQRVADLEKK